MALQQLFILLISILVSCSNGQGSGTKSDPYVLACNELRSDIATCNECNHIYFKLSTTKTRDITVTTCDNIDTCKDCSVWNVALGVYSNSAYTNLLNPGGNIDANGFCVDPFDGYKNQEKVSLTAMTANDYYIWLTDSPSACFLEEHQCLGRWRLRVECSGDYPTFAPTKNPTPNTLNPTADPSKYPTTNPTMFPSQYPSVNPSQHPTVRPTFPSPTLNVDDTSTSTTTKSTLDGEARLSTYDTSTDTPFNTLAGTKAELNESEGTNSITLIVIVTILATVLSIILLVLCVVLIFYFKRKDKMKNEIEKNNVDTQHILSDGTMQTQVVSNGLNGTNEGIDDYTVPGQVNSTNVGGMNGVKVQNPTNGGMNHDDEMEKIYDKSMRQKTGGNDDDSEESLFDSVSDQQNETIR